jgi:hypothetical protein
MLARVCRFAVAGSACERSSSGLWHRYAPVWQACGCIAHGVSSCGSHKGIARAAAPRCIGAPPWLHPCVPAHAGGVKLHPSAPGVWTRDIHKPQRAHGMGCRHDVGGGRRPCDLGGATACRGVLEAGGVGRNASVPLAQPWHTCCWHGCAGAARFAAWRDWPAAHVQLQATDDVGCCGTLCDTTLRAPGFTVCVCVCV